MGKINLREFLDGQKYKSNDVHNEPPEPPKEKGGSGGRHDEYHVHDVFHKVHSKHKSLSDALTKTKPGHFVGKVAKDDRGIDFSRSKTPIHTSGTITAPRCMIVSTFIACLTN